MIAAGVTLAAIVPFCVGRGLAVPVSTPAPSWVPTPNTSAPPGTLPIESSVVFVLEDSISSSASRKNDVVRVHLKDPLVIGGVTVAPANTPAQIDVLDAEPAQIGDVYGFVDIYFRSLHLPDGRVLPLRAPTSHLTVNVSTGHQTTVGAEDTVADVIIPYHFLYHAFRKGRNFVLGAGSEIRARTEATLTVTPKGTVAITTPVPVVVGGGPPHPTFSAMPIATPGEKFAPHHSTPKPSPTPSPAISPSPEDSHTP
ncbi:MAG: hypothetical protein M3M96_04670 [Candidatus Eremiobacteraeota bacterium]|nr:hypothetical protein [Candidatus Eremiobacteraeota bacterium]